MKIFDETYGPLTFWALLFACASIIKYFAYDDTNLLYDIPIELSLWSVGILFTLAASEKTYYNAKLTQKFTKKTTGPGYEIDYEVKVGDDYGFKPKFLYLFLISIVIWIICIILKYEIEELLNLEKQEGKQLLIATGIYYLLGIFSTAIAIISTLNVNK